MKKTSLLTSVALISSLGLVGCGGGSGGDNIERGNTQNTPSASTSSVSGIAIDPELVGATVCLDLNLNETCDENEPTATTDEDGNFNLSVLDRQLESSAPLLVMGGTDKESGEAFKGKLLADVNSSFQNITPLTTLAYKTIQNYADDTQKNVTSAIEKLEMTLGLTYDEIQANILTLADEGKTRALKTALVIQKSAEALSPEDTLHFYEMLVAEMGKANQTVSTLSSLILSLAPDDMDSKIQLFIDTILNSTFTNAYALADQAREAVLESNIDYETMMGTVSDKNPLADISNPAGNETAMESQDILNNPSSHTAPDMNLTSPTQPNVPDEVPTNPSTPDTNGTQPSNPTSPMKPTIPNTGF